MEAKETVRKEMKIKIKSQKVSERRQRSRVVHKKLFLNESFLKSKCVMLYCSKGTGEVETRPIIKQALKMGKKVVLPVTLVRNRNIKPVYLRDIKKLGKGPYGIYEPRGPLNRTPAELKNIDLVIVPGIAFDRNHNRIGRGKGYYDNFLRSLPKKGKSKIGLGFRFQLLDKVPTTKRDIPLTSVLTD
ncbi:MAG: 5-formyltetrahydrofolate cyclo-ligase [Candidatus Omnitrophica bacterium]|nr:5-formyltetrahydrofolate cyclo-ligase [Candidatus Omnitrophota bacterium]